MLELFADFAFGIAMSAGGAGVGWLLHRTLYKTPSRLPEEQITAKNVLARLKELANHMAANVGQHSVRVAEINQELTHLEPHGPEGVISVVARLIESNQMMQSQLGAVEEKLHEQSRLVEAKVAEARTDALTGLANRRAFDDEVASCQAEFKESRRPFSLILGDIDHFKKFNDMHGHLTGDEVLRGTARTLRESARENDFVARYGGEEMAIVLPGANIAEAVRAVERARQAVEKACFRSPSSELNVTMSFGVAELMPGEDQKQLIGRADAALYAAKEAGRNRCCWHDGQMIRPIARPCDLAEKGGQSPFAGTARRVLGTNGDRPPFSAQQKPDAAGEFRAGKGDSLIFADTKIGTVPEFHLCSKSEFALSLGRRLAEWRRRGDAPSLLLMRIDNFAGLAQRFGQEVAGIVLRSARQFLAGSIRAMDLGSEYAEATYAMLLPGAGATELVRVAERLRQAVARCVLSIGGCSVQFTVSLAAAVAIQTDTSELMLARVEEALAQATAAGGNCIYLHTGQQIEPAQTAKERTPATAAV